MLRLLDHLNPIRDHIDELSFGEIVRGCRNALGMKQYRMAQILGLSWHKLRNLETNRFMDMPPLDEIHKICHTFELPYDQVIRVIERQVDAHRHRMVIEKHPRYVARIEKGQYIPKRGVKCSFDSTRSL